MSVYGKIAKEKPTNNKIKIVDTVETSPMQCNPNCPYFPNVDVSSYDWEMDEKSFYKKRKKQKKYICTYDGHQITNWYSPCPAKLNGEMNKQ